MFLTWALDDVRCLDQMVWQHLAPRLYPELQAALEEVVDSAKQNNNDMFADKIQEHFQPVCAETAGDATIWFKVVVTLVEEEIGGIKEV